MSSMIFRCDRNTARGTARRILASASWLACLTAVFILMCAGTAMAQLSGKGAITGTVADKTGAVIPGAVIAATNDATGITTTTTSTGAGNFTFSNLDPGIYSVTTSAKGFQKLSQKNIHVNAMESQAYNPELTVGGANDEIIVTAAPPQLETSNAALGATMENEMYSELPIEMGAFGSADQRRATDFAYLMPGVQGNVTNGNATTNTGVINGSGSRGAASAVYIDGVPFVRAGGNGDPRYVWTAVSVDAIDQFLTYREGDAFGLTIFSRAFIHWVPLTLDTGAMGRFFPHADLTGCPQPRSRNGSGAPGPRRRSPASRCMPRGRPG